MAGYGMVRTYAEILHRDDIAKILQETRQEENGADNKLAQQINVQAKRDVAA
jgi:ferritin-like metal-binding protein YciE